MRISEVRSAITRYNKIRAIAERTVKEESNVQLTV